MSTQDRIITWNQLSEHVRPTDCWILIDGFVYDVSDFIVQHPGGDQPLLKNSGLDGTQNFQNIGHSQYAVSLRNARKVGKIQNNVCPQGHYQKVIQLKTERNIQLKSSNKNKVFNNLAPNLKHPDAQADFISRELIKRHNTLDDCWVIINSNVCDVTPFLNSHPGGSDAIFQYAGKDASKAFNNMHKDSEKAKMTMQNLRVGKVRKNPNIPLNMVVGLVLLIITYYVCTQDL